VIASMYAVYHGPEGLRKIASRVSHLAAVLARGLAERGWPILTKQFFDTIVIEVGEQRDTIVSRAGELGLNLRRLPGRIGISVDETTTAEIVERVWIAFGSTTGPAGGKCAL